MHNDWITAIFEDSKKRLWIGTDQDGPYLLNSNTGKFFNYNLYLPPQAEKIKGIWQFLEDSRGNIWVSAHNGYFLLNDKTNHFEPMDSLLRMNHTYSSGIGMDHAGNLWFATTGGIKKLSADRKLLTDKNNNPQQLPLFSSGLPVSAVAFDDFNNIWIGSGYDRKLYRYNLVSNNFHQYVFNSAAQEQKTVRKPDNAIGRICISNKGEVIVPLFSRGIAIYDYAADSFNIINADNSLSYGFHVNMEEEGSISITQDNKNNIWVGTDNGINIIDISKPSFTVYKNPSYAYDLLPAAEASDFLQTKTAIFMQAITFGTAA